MAPFIGSEENALFGYCEETALPGSEEIKHFLET
jgi:hypothetical protein